MSGSLSSSTIQQDDAQPSSQTTHAAFADLPPVFVLPAHLSSDKLHDIEEKLAGEGARLTYDPTEAKLFLSQVTHKRRAILELRSLGVWTEQQHESSIDQLVNARKQLKRKRQSPVHANASFASGESSTESDIENVSTHGIKTKPVKHTNTPSSPSALERECEISNHKGAVHVIQTVWLEDSLKAKKPLPLEPYIIFEGVRTAKSSSPASEKSPPSLRRRTQTPSSPSLKNVTPDVPQVREDILERARADAGPERELEAKTYASKSQLSNRHAHFRRSNRPPALIQQGTSGEESSGHHELPEMPDWVKQGKVFACERSTPASGPNDAFVDQLKKIRLARELTTDEIGVRAYSTSIAAVAAYPYSITSAQEILALPGCDTKIATLWTEWKNNNGYIAAAYDAENDDRLKVIKLFYDIWGVGAYTAREFYNKGWRSLDDVVEFGWNELSRVQQIGVKYYDEFLVKLPREEVESIAEIIHQHAQKVREPTGVRTCIVGGYRRGKVESGDVDLILSHTDESQTLDVIHDVVQSLFDAGWVTHELKIVSSGSKRDQATLPYRGGLGGGHGFDTLDKAMVVWQDPNWPGKENASEGTKNPNIHRRVDIIIAPWSKVGCAVLGWTAGTTFERDLRRYCRKIKGWKFDSSGIRDRATGHEVDLESVGGKSVSCEEAEKKVFKGLGLPYREPWERCTG